MSSLIFPCYHKWGLWTSPTCEVDNCSMNKLYRKQIGERIKNYRISKGLSREEVAFNVGISGSYLGMIERGEYDFKISKLFLIAKAMEISPEDLIKNL